MRSGASIAGQWAIDAARALLFALLLFGVAETASSAQTLTPQPESDTQVWTDLLVGVPVTNRVDFLLSGTWRIGRDVSFLVDRRVGLGFQFRVGKYLTLVPSYTNITMRPSRNRKINENRLNFAATVRFPVEGFIVSDRNLFERRLRFPLNSTRYRNRLQVERSVKLGSRKFGLFASDEIFYDWSVDDWVRNRFSLGLSRGLNKNLTTDLYYMRQNDGRARPGDLHVIGTTLRVRL